MNAIVKGNGAQLPAELANLGNALIQEGQSATGISDLLRFLAREGGIWVFGAEAVENEEGARWAINPLSFEHGYVCWKAKKIAGEAMVAIGVAKVPRETLQDHGTYTDGKGKEVQTTWDEQMSIRLRCVAGEDEGTEVDFRTSTVGGLSCIKASAKAIGARISSGKTDVVAVVDLTNDSYTHKEYGKMYVPQMTIESWIEMDGGAVSESDSASEPADEVEEAPAADAPAPRRGRRAASQGASEPASENVPEEAPARRRRSRSA
jgi:hypothetical protein